MTLFKILRGNESDLPMEVSDGTAYFCTDSGNLYIDYSDSAGGISRKQVNAGCADKIRYVDGEEYVEIDATTLVGRLVTVESQVLLDSFIMADAITGELHVIQIQNGQLVSFPITEQEE